MQATSLPKKPYLIAGTAGLVAVLSLYYFFDPHQGSFPACPFYQLTGWFCTGCGSQRALHDLLHLNLWESLGHNLLLLPALVLVAWHGAHLAGVGPQAKSPLGATRAPKYILLVIGIFTLARNLPWDPFHYLAP